MLNGLTRQVSASYSYRIAAAGRMRAPRKGYEDRCARTALKPRTIAFAEAAARRRTRRRVLRFAATCPYRSLSDAWLTHVRRWSGSTARISVPPPHECVVASV